MPPFIFGRSNVVQTLRFENGTEQQPGLAFKSNPASGLFEENGNVCVSVSGTKVMTVHAGGLSTNAIVCDSVNGSSYSQLTVTSVQITDSSYNAIDDTALSTTSTGYFTMGGNGFGPGTVVKVGDILASSTAFVSTTELRVSVTAQATGTYTVTVIRGDLATATLVNGITFSPFPAWSTSSALGNVNYGSPFSFQLAASDALVYSNTTPLPPSTTLSSGGLLEGNIVANADATYTFIVDATDGEFQNTLRTFSLNYLSIPTTVSQIKSAYGSTSGVYEILLGGVLKNVFFDLDGTYTNGNTSGWMLYQSFGTSPAASFQNAAYGNNIVGSTLTSNGWTTYTDNINDFTNYIRFWSGAASGVVGYITRDNLSGFAASKICIKYGCDPGGASDTTAQLRVNNAVVSTASYGTTVIYTGNIDPIGTKPVLRIEETGTYGIASTYYIFVQ